MNKKEIDECIADRISADRFQHPGGLLGVIVSYSRYDNTATVAVSKPDSDEIEDILHKVPCPVLLGVQSVAPTPGTPCYVALKGGNKRQALVTHYYNHNYSRYNYSKQNHTDSLIPSYLLGE